MERLIKPYIAFNEVEAELKEIFESGIFTKGKYVEMFRDGVKKYTGAEHSFLTTSATTALWLSLKAAGIRTGDEVVVSDFSFPATANASANDIPRSANMSGSGRFAAISASIAVLSVEEMKPLSIRKLRRFIYVKERKGRDGQVSPERPVSSGQPTR